MKIFTEKVVNREDLTIAEMEKASELLFSTEVDEVEKAGFLIALKAKGEVVSELTGLAKVMQKKATGMPQIFGEVMDNCGTGGDSSKSFNISTTSAFVLAGAGITVAKHGNRSISSKTGSADVLEELGVKITSTPVEMAEKLAENGIAFLFAQHVHPSMKRIMPVRKKLKVPTLFNLIGPLTNPVPLSTQFLGVYRRDMIANMAEVLNQLGRKRAIVVYGNGGMDEASLAGTNQCVLLENGETTVFDISPEEVGLPRMSNAEIVGGDAKTNAQILRDILTGKRGPKRDVVVLNAALGFYANGKVTSVQEGVTLAQETIDSGAALEKLNNLIG